ncbi:MAG: hypothetical protein JXR75_13605 [Rhodobacteraceae bacterium]|nr:hypothetical protein [Paracoccaceae bacterium]
MTIQFSTVARNAALDSIESVVGATPVLEIRTEAVPANCAAADSGALLVSLSLPADWMAAAAGGSKSLAGSWTAAASAAGVAGHFRVKQGATCHVQGTITATGGGGDLTLDNTSIAVLQNVTITEFTLTAGGA